MQATYQQHFVCNVTSPEHYVTGGVPPAIMTSYPAMDYGVSPAIIQDMTQAGGVMPVFLKLGDNLVVPQGNTHHMLPQLTPGVPALQYVAVPPNFAPLPAFAPPAPVKAANSDTMCQLEQLQGRHLAMSEVNQMLPPVEMRSILVPRRRSGQRSGKLLRLPQLMTSSRITSSHVYVFFSTSKSIRATSQLRAFVAWQPGCYATQQPVDRRRSNQIG